MSPLIFLRACLKKQNKKQSGFSLVDNLFAVAVFTIGMIGLMTLQKTLQTGSGSVGDNMNAQRLASSQIEKIRVLASRGQIPTTCTDSVVCNDSTAIKIEEVDFTDCQFSRSIGSTSYNVYIQITDSTSTSCDSDKDSCSKNVDVKCCWKKDRVHQVNLTTLLNESLYTSSLEDDEEEE